MIDIKVSQGSKRPSRTDIKPYFRKEEADSVRQLNAKSDFEDNLVKDNKNNQELSITKIGENEITNNYINQHHDSSLPKLNNSIIEQNNYNTNQEKKGFDYSNYNEPVNKALNISEASEMPRVSNENSKDIDMEINNNKVKGFQFIKDQAKM